MIKINQITKFIIGALALLILGWILWQVRQIGVYFGISVVLALMGRPLMLLLNRVKIADRHLPNWLKALLVMITFIGLISLLFRIFIPILNSQIAIITSLDVEKLLIAFEEPLHRLERWADEMNIQGIDEETIRLQIANSFNVSILGDFASRIVSGLGDVLVGVFSVLFITFFLLKERDITNNIVDALTPDKYLPSIRRIITDTKNLLSRYFIGIALQVSIITTIVSVGLTIVGIPNALLIGLIAGVINIIPYLGPIIGGVIGVTLGLLSNVHLDLETELFPLLVKTLLVFATAQLTDNLVLQPVIFSKSVKAHPLEIFIVIMIAGTLAGIGGMILAIPVYSFLRIVAREFFQGYKVVQGLTKDL
ncbi:MAG: AI-2E family transporter [Flavobacteriales bacterium]|nr:AI-2E family transporter [Flavobacteriales bacterium]